MQGFPSGALGSAVCLLWLARVASLGQSVNFGLLQGQVQQDESRRLGCCCRGLGSSWDDGFGVESNAHK